HDVHRRARRREPLFPDAASLRDGRAAVRVPQSPARGRYWGRASRRAGPHHRGDSLTNVTIVGLGGSLAPHSTSLSALSVALDGARDYGADVQLFDLRELNLPMFIPDTDPVPAAARELCDAVSAARGMLWSSPLYHGTISGAVQERARLAP